MTSPTTKAAVYCRISEDEDDEKLGVARQREDCLKRVEREGWTLVSDATVGDTFTDNDVSGGKDATQRAAFGRLTAAIATGKVDVVVAYKQARIYRDAEKILAFFHFCKGAGVKLVALVADPDVDPTKSLMVPTIIGAVDEEYRINIGELSARKKQERAERGLPSGGGIRAFGYNWPHRVKGTGGRERYVEPDSEAEPYSIYEPEAAAIRWAYTHILDEDGSISGVQREWISRDLPTVRGGTRADGTPAWCRNSIKRILTGTRIVGLRTHKKKVMDGVVASWEPVVTRERWEAMCAVLSDPTRANRPHSPDHDKYPLRGLLLCGKCGRTMSGTVRNDKAPSYRYYFCRKDDGGCQEGGAWVSAHNIEAWVIGLVIGVAQSSDALGIIQAESGVLADELRGLVAERHDVQGKLDRLESKWANDTISEKGYLAARKDFQKAIRTAEDRISAIEASSALGPQVEGSLMTAWGHLTKAEQRRIIVSLVSQVTVMPNERRGGNVFDPKRAKIAWRSSALALAAGCTEVPEGFELPAGVDIDIIVSDDPDFLNTVASTLATVNTLHYLLT